MAKEPSNAPPTPLFRSAALAAQRDSGLAPIALVGPPALRVLTVFGVSLALALVAVFYFGTYTAHRTLRGRLVTEQGVIEVRSAQAGIVLERRVGEGASVERGDVLYVISSERVSREHEGVQATIAERLDARRRSFVERIANTRLLAQLEQRSLEQSSATLAREVATLDEAATTQAARAALASEVATRYERLRATGFVSEEQLLLKRADLLEQRGRSHALDRERTNAVRQREELASRVAMAEIDRANGLAELESAIAEVDLQLAENEVRRAVALVAPADGVVTGIGADVGAAVDAAMPLAFVVPAGAALRADLYAPSRAAGFLVVGQRVRLRYEAFPYQKFGHHDGSIAAISETALSPAALDVIAAGSSATPLSRAIAEPMYRVTVELRRQTVATYGDARPLRPGMSVEADVLLESRRLYEWMFEPLYALAARGA